MSTIWLGVIFAVILLTSMYLISEKKVGKLIMGTLVGVTCFMAIVILIVSFNLDNRGSVFHENHREFCDYIFSTKNDSYIYGRFSMGSGRIDEVEMYIYYTQSSAGGYIRKMVKADDSVIFESDEIPHVDLVLTSYKTSWWIFYSVSEIKTNFYFYVPKGTIIQDYVLE